MVKVVFSLLLLFASALPAQQTWDAVREQRIGSVDHPEQSLTRIGDVILGANGVIYVAQPQDGLIKVFDRTGQSIQTIGGRGRGPGEFEALRTIGFIGDTLYATDTRLRRVSHFNREGSLIRTYDLASPLIVEGPRQVYPPTVPVLLLDDGTALVWPSMSVAWRAAGNDRLPLWRLDMSTLEIDTIAEVTLGIPNAIVTHAGRRLGVPKPFPDAPLFELHADGSGLVVVDREISTGDNPARFRVTKITLTGDTTFASVFEYEPQPITSALVNDAISSISAELARRYADSPPTSRIRHDLEQAGHIPDRLPPVLEMATGVDGSIWIKREAVQNGRSLWQVLGAQGTVIAEIRLGTRESVRYAAENALLTVERDELDVPYINRYRIAK